MELSGPAQRRYDDLVAVAERTVVGLDMDGTLAPIVADPDRARIHPAAADVLVALAGQVRGVAVITGRPAAQAVAMGDLDRVADRIQQAGGCELFVFGQYGHERWSSTRRAVAAPPPPAGLGAFRAGLPPLLADADATDVHVEEKGLGIAVHTRRTADPAATMARLAGPVEELAAAHGLTVEPGRQVLEVRAPGTSKGDAVQALARELDAGGFLFAGDDLGDLDAFDAVSALRARGLPTLLVCSSSTEEQALAARADVTVNGPDGVLELLGDLAHDAG